MTRTFVKAPESGGVCSACEHDLGIRPTDGRGFECDGKVYCSNPRCEFHRKAHPTGKGPNSGRGKAKPR